MNEDTTALVIPAAIAIACVFMATRTGSIFENSILERLSGQRFRRYALILGGVFGGLAIWQLGAMATGTAGSGRIATYYSSLKALFQLLGESTLLKDFQRSLSRIIIGFGISLVVGMGMGLLAGTFVLVNRLLLPTASFLRYIPPTAFVTVMILYFGVGEPHKYAVIFLATVFFNFQMTVDAVLAIDRAYWEMAKVDRMSPIKLLRWVVVPGAGPQLWTTFRINLSFAWTFLTAAEIVASDGGLGSLLTRSQRFLRVDDVFAIMLFFGVIGLGTDMLLSWIGRYLFRWRHTNHDR